MTDMVKKYVPYAVIILLVYMLLPLVFIPGAMQKFSPVAYDFVFPITAIGCSAPQRLNVCTLFRSSS